jgi:hypothetical protein
VFNALLVCLVCSYVGFGGWVFTTFESAYDVNDAHSTLTRVNRTADSNSRLVKRADCLCTPPVVIGIVVRIIIIFFV